MNRAVERAQVRRRAGVATAVTPDSSPARQAASEARQPDEDELGAMAASSGGDGDGEVTRVGYAPIVRVDTARREIELCATSEAVDSYGTVFDYEASKTAFARWLGNVREMHARRAVGRRIAVRCDDGERRIYVRVRISTGAQDTWEKIGDGTLRGASIGASNVVWTFQTRRVAGHDQVVQVATAYDLVELSLVDNPSNPDALGITIVRAAEPVEALLAELEDIATDEGTEGTGPRGGDGGGAENAEVAEVRGGRGEGESRENAKDAKVREERGEDEGERGTAESAEDAEAEQRIRGIAEDAKGRGREGREGREDREAAQGHAGHADLSAPHASPPDEKTAERAQGPFSENAAGAPDMGVPARAPEPMPTVAQMPAAGNARERFHAAARGIMGGCGCGRCEAALAALGSPDDGADTDTNAQEERGVAAAVREAALARAVAAGLAAEARQVERMETSVRALGDALHTALGSMGTTLDGALGDLRARLERIEAQPLPGGPALRAVEKSHALAPAPAPGANAASPEEQYRALEALAGKLSDPQAQIAVAAELIRLRAREGR